MDALKSNQELIQNDTFLQSERHQTQAIFLLSRFLVPGSLLSHLIGNYQVRKHLNKRNIMQMY